MPIERPTNSLFRIRDLSVGLSGQDYYLNMNPGKAQACVLCICRSHPITAQELNLTEENLDYLYSGGVLNFDAYVLRGITGNQLAAIAHYRDLQLQPPTYVQAWAMTAGPNGKTLYIPEDPKEQTTIVSVRFQVIINSGSLLIMMDEKEGYQDGDLLYQIENRLPIPIPKKWIGVSIPLHCNPEKLKVFPDAPVEQNYIQKRN